MWVPFDGDQTGTVIEHCREGQLGGGRSKGAGQAVDTLTSWRENSRAAFNLKNSVQVGYVGWEEQKGLNLGYSDHATTDTAHKMARWFFRRHDGSNQTVRYGELIAMGYGTAPSFFKYAVTEVGINLENTGTPLVRVAAHRTSGDGRPAGEDGSVAGDLERRGARVHHLRRPARRIRRAVVPQ